MVGLFFACLLIISFNLEIYLHWDQLEPVEDFVLRLHCWLYVIFWNIRIMGMYLTSGAIIIFYGLFGTLMGRIQQIINPSVKWFLTGLLAVFILIFYISSIYLAWWWENA